jgi:DNA repair exonuclease SbcCD ATPase subunit
MGIETCPRCGGEPWSCHCNPIAITACPGCAVKDQRIGELNDAKDAFQTECEIMSELMAAKDRRIQQLEQEQAFYIEANIKLRDELAAKDRELAELQKEVTNLRTRIEGRISYLETEQQAFREQAAKRAEELDAKDEEIRQLKATHSWRLLAEKDEEIRMLAFLATERDELNKKHLEEITRLNQQKQAALDVCK